MKVPCSLNQIEFITASPFFNEKKELLKILHKKETCQDCDATRRKLMKNNWKFKILFGWDLRCDLIDINLFTVHLEEMVRWVEIIGCVFYWEKN